MEKISKRLCVYITHTFDDNATERVVCKPLMVDKSKGKKMAVNRPSQFCSRTFVTELLYMNMKIEYP